MRDPSPQLSMSHNTAQGNTELDPEERDESAPALTDRPLTRQKWRGPMRSEDGGMAKRGKQGTEIDEMVATFAAKVSKNL